MPAVAAGMGCTDRIPGGWVVEALPIRLHLATTDPEVVAETLRRAYATAQVRAPRHDPAFGYRQDVHGDTDLALGRFLFRGRGRVDLVLEEKFTVSWPRSGTLHWQIDGHRGTGLALIQPHQDYRSTLELLRVDTADLSLEALTRTARTVYGDERLTLGFNAPQPVSARMADYWQATCTYVRQTLTDPATAGIALLRAELLRRLAVATLEAFPLAGDPHARRESVAARQAAYTAAVEFLHAAASLPITLEDVARHAQVSTLELVRAFRSHAGITPGAYLRGVRLAAAHQDLVAADPTAGDTVGTIAARWGFPHPGDFARRHRAAYGVPPSHTLHR
ncbi:hypothetical protein GCM10011374_36760 [Kocuria dechangensis]|uniref:HTH araC/xylS-type domain-containing protein n=1 Tax=Kocuria dechangensis TaxID=1176249 RepID=A0A917M0M8_9MICC|nr:helix-turn-helix transcriptional regulator [Kocuria dechangensis]GGG68972.1 hypothetical protein GCM10011374_36760 [Kocuria dechangensis]